MKTRLILSALAFFVILIGRAPADQETTQAIADRYEQLLLASPQSGAPFDRVIEWYATQGGGLESLQKRWKESAASGGEQRRSYQILSGLLAERLRLPEEARGFYQAAMTEGDAAAAARLLAVLETTEGRFDAAAKAYEAALASESLAAVDRMELMRSLALLHQRAFADDKALAVWRDAVKRFPGDPYVLEEAGEAFLAAGAYEEARTAFTQLKDASARDPFRRVAASLRLARTAELESKADDAVRIYELALEDTSDGSWINREVRARIEELFRRKDDLPGLLSYYERRTKAVPQDAQSLAAHAAVLDDLGRPDEALEKLTAATKLAPENTALRLDLIRSLSGKGRTAEALAEAETLARPAEAPPEVLVVLGNLHWAAYETSKSDVDRAAAMAAWRRIAPDDSNDLARMAQLAEILAAHDQLDEAVAQWQRIVTQSPQSADARQRIAEVQKKRGDKAAALSTLAGLTAGQDAAAEEYLTLARIQEKMEWLTEARATGQAGLEKFPDDYELLNLNWRLASEAKDEKAA
ncbi:MAG TPA: tetratricopeptide repeat protein, partial [Terrimicrobiaceae bacterium]|nr:tetratricopeptide repeat protein [Terrimicrobiaceae bacterium]